jgi:glycosyltransferase involved in cell wall biosynthesis
VKVLVVHNRYRSAQPSGENVLVEDEASLLEEHGCRVERLVVSSDDIAGWRTARKALLPARVVWSSDGYRRTAATIERFRPDVVHFHNTFPLLSPSTLWAARRSGVAVVQTLHNFRPLCPAGTLARDGRICEECLGRLPLPAVRHGCYRGSRAATVPLGLMSAVHDVLGTWSRCVDVLVVPSEFARRKYVEAGWPAHKLAVKHNTVRDPGVQRRGPGSGFVCLSRLEDEKGVDVLLRAWSEAFPRGEQKLVVVGSGSCELVLGNAARSRHGVELRGRVDRRRALRLVETARAVVAPVRCYEIFGLTLVEAYALGVPVVGSKIGAVGEIVDDEQTGLLVSPESVPELARALGRLAESPELSVRLGAGARRAYETRFHPAETTERLLGIYEGAVRNGGRG